jgi:hypothetical protein
MTLKQLNELSIDRISKDDFSSFRELVISDIKSEVSQEVIDYLHDHLDLWHYSLQLLRKEIELQLSCQNTKVQMHKNNVKLNNSNYSEEDFILYSNKQHNWRMTAVKFLSNIERKTLYVKILLKNS